MAANKPQGTDRTFQFSDPAAIAGIILVTIAAAWVTWFFAHEEISALYVYIRYVEIWLLNLMGAFIDIPVLSAVHRWVQRMCAPESQVLLCTRDFSTIRWSDVSNSSMVFNILLLIPLAAWCFSMSRRAAREHPTIRFAKNHTIQSFAKENAQLYPHLKLFSVLDMVAKPLNDPVFGMSFTSRQFAYKHRLISGWQETADGQYIPILNREAANAVLREQLGQHWTRSADLTPGETLLLAIVLPRVAATDPVMDDAAFHQALTDSDELIKWCWGYFTPPEAKAMPKEGTTKAKPSTALDAEDEYAWLRPDFDLDCPRAIITRYIRHPMVTDIIARHAYRRTILYACYMRASALGVFPPADVRWMRFYDRELWYLRSSIGRQVAFAEGGSAVYSHYLYELKADHAIVEPQIDKAVNGLESAMHAFKYTKADKDAYEASG